LVSGIVRASSAAFSTLRRAYARLAREGVRTSIATMPTSEAGRKEDPPTVACRASAPTKLATAMRVIDLRWCSAQAMTLP